MAVNVERDPMVFAIDDDPMRAAARYHDAARPLPAVADPAPLGLAALAITTLVFSVFNAGLLNRSGLPVVLGVAVAYGGIAELLAGMWEFRRGNAFGAMAFGSFGAFWLSYWALEQFLVKQIPLAEVGNATALFFIVWAIFAAGWFGIATAAAGLYAAFAALINSTYERTVLPLRAVWHVR